MSNDDDHPDDPEENTSGQPKTGTGNEHAESQDLLSDDNLFGELRDLDTDELKKAKEDIEKRYVAKIKEFRDLANSSVDNYHDNRESRAGWGGWNLHRRRLGPHAELSPQHVWRGGRRRTPAERRFVRRDYWRHGTPRPWSGLQRVFDGGAIRRNLPASIRGRHLEPHPGRWCSSVLERAGIGNRLDYFRAGH